MSHTLTVLHVSRGSVYQRLRLGGPRCFSPLVDLPKFHTTNCECFDILKKLANILLPVSIKTNNLIYGAGSNFISNKAKFRTMLHNGIFESNNFLSSPLFVSVGCFMVFPLQHIFVKIVLHLK